MIRLTYAPDLVEEAVLLAERTAPAADVRAFRRERDRIYAVVDERAREAAFQSLHVRRFAALGLNQVIERVVRERADVARRVSHGRVRRALTRRDECADLADDLAPSDAPSTAWNPPTLILSLGPQTLLEPDVLKTLLHHELTHVADMLDPAFGYQRSLPASDDGPSADLVLRDRYRVVWDTTIDGRLARAGLAAATARETRWRQFAAAFPMPGDACSCEFERWFGEKQPTHAGIVAFATARQAPDGSDPSPGVQPPSCRENYPGTAK